MGLALREMSQKFAQKFPEIATEYVAHGFT